MTEPLAFALETARRAGALLRDYANQRQAVRSKSTDIDLVTEADLASEQLIVDAIRAEFPAHKILSEEGLGDPADPSGQGLRQMAAETPYLWLVDPLDGTVNYAHSFPMWSVSLALAERGQVTMGVSCDPLRDDVFWAERGRGAWFGDTRLQVSQTAKLREALVATGFAYKRATLARTWRGDAPGNNLAEFSLVMPRVQGVRRAGSAILDLAYLAAGRLDAYWEMYLNPWDWAAGFLLITEAGGVVTNLRGQPWTLGTNNLLASNGPLHAELLALFQQARRE